MRTIQVTDTYIEAQRELGFTEGLFTRARNRLAVLYSCLNKGTDPPRQRKVYRSRAPLTKGKHESFLPPEAASQPLALVGSPGI